MGYFNINYRPWTTIKGQALVDFIAKFTYSNIIEVAGTTDNAEATKKVERGKSEASVTKQEDSDPGVEQWVLYIDGASKENG